MRALWKRIKLLEVKKDSNQTRMDFYGVLIPTLLSRKLFKNNKDLKELTNKFKVQTEIRDYLYDNRTALIAKLIREFEKNTKEELEYNVKLFKKIVLEMIDKTGDISTNEVTHIINKYSRNHKEELDE
ncbi:hypothetical protein C161_13508 [Paenibacillus sp. FSL R5-192]|uniref:hypothetical protein n=1 Tax=Paenibacillus sp. FSL R5-192 TaxID=1226754 RepID=UPI0003E2C778|nr:hypothetical protein [Paenibacillus sp. FSL R5-192]ETT37531.1 hypothetical protein C161_13508 [Paenibacillus sp. FSL R5-192]